MRMKITILFKPNRVSLMYTLYPLWISKFNDRFIFTTSLEWVINKDRNNALLLVGWVGQNKLGTRNEILEKLRFKYKSFFFFDDNDGSESHFLDFLPFVDIYYKKQVFRDRSLYLTDFYGNRIFANYYNKEFGIEENPLPLPLPKVDKIDHLKKIKVGWNLAFGQYPISKSKVFFGKKIFFLFGSKCMSRVHSKYPLDKTCPKPTIAKCQARFNDKAYRKTVGFQRRLFSEKVQGKEDFLTGVISLNQYNHEIKNVQAILSPFGWGEVCFRDIEAILNGAVLIKPLMDHLETWPNLYQPGKTYVPILWDGSDLIDQVSNILKDSKKLEYLRTNAWIELREARTQIENKIQIMISEICSFV